MNVFLLGVEEIKLRKHRSMNSLAKEKRKDFVNKLGYNVKLD